MYRYIAICWILLAGAGCAQAQYDSLQFQLVLKPDNKELRSLLRDKLDPVSSVAIRPLLRQALQTMHEAGYLREAPSDLSEKLGASEDRIETLLTEMKQFDPTGVFARDLQECLALQILQGHLSDPYIALI